MLDITALRGTVKSTPKIKKTCKSLDLQVYTIYGFIEFEKFNFHSFIPYRGESRIRTYEVLTADLQSALVGRLSISPDHFYFQSFKRT